ncbi:MAG: hypothetical protein JWM16_2983 [Verrucomicrobiales bacterium]|nr:hypothetical protein [Verrucomicrobiales bacterium]
MKQISFLSSFGPLAAVVVTGLLAQFPSSAWAEGEKRFGSAEEAVQALAAAAKAKDTNALQAVFGPVSRELISPDIVQASEEREGFIQRLNEKIDLEKSSENRAVLNLGADRWLFPIPLVKAGGAWFFDTEAGREEILNRRVGRNELGAIGVCRQYVEAQREYASRDRNSDQVLEYAMHLRSAPGTHDGLFWPVREGDEVSPFGPLIAQARVEGYRRENKALMEETSPYRGYFFKILNRQGKHAPGGKYDYVINGHMIAGFALVAWPAEYGNSGVKTFIVNQQGAVYEKDLGPKTATTAKAMTVYDPDSSWRPAQASSLEGPGPVAQPATKDQK